MSFTNLAIFPIIIEAKNTITKFTKFIQREKERIVTPLFIPFTLVLQIKSSKHGGFLKFKFDQPLPSYQFQIPTNVIFYFHLFKIFFGLFFLQDSDFKKIEIFCCKFSVYFNSDFQKKLPQFDKLASFWAICFRKIKSLDSF